MELILHKVCGHPAQQAVTLRRCTPDEAPAVYALQNEVHAAMLHPEWFVTDTLEHITGYITDSLCIGVWQGSRLGAYPTFHYCGQSPHNYAAFLGVPQAEWPHWANPYSLSNALACGFTIRARREMYGGFDRYLLAKEL